MKNEYDSRCANCDHYQWTGFFANALYDYEDDFYRQHKCPCACHNIQTKKKLMRFSFTRGEKGKSKHVMYVEKLAICPFCKRSEFEDSVFARNPGTPESDHMFDYNDLWMDERHHKRLKTPCAGNHKHEWYKCKCGRDICKISFRNYFGYEMDDELFDNHLVDQSHYSEQAKALQDKDQFERKYHNYNSSIDVSERKREEPKPDEVPIYETMETIEKIWGKLPRYREHYYFDKNGKKCSSMFSGWNNPEVVFYHYYEDEITRPTPLRITDFHDATLSDEDVLKIQKDAQKALQHYLLLQVHGIGKITAKKLLKKFRNADRVFSATTKEIAKALDISENRAEVIRKKMDQHDMSDIENQKKSFRVKDWRNPSYRYRPKS